MLQHLQGSGIMWKSYGFPVFLLTESGTKTLQEVLHSIFMFFFKLATQDTSDGLYCILRLLLDLRRQTLDTQFFGLNRKKGMKCKLSRRHTNSNLMAKIGDHSKSQGLYLG